MKNILIVALVVAIMALVAKIAYDVRKLVMRKKALKNAKRVYMVRVTSYHTEAFFFVNTKEEATKIALDWRNQIGVLDLELTWMIEQDAQLFKEVLTQGFGFDKNISTDGAEMFVGEIPATKTPD